MSQLLSDRELAQMQSDIEKMTLPDTCTIQTRTETADGMGGVTQTWADTYTFVPFRLDAHKGYEQLGGDALRPYQEFTATIPQKYAVTAQQRVVHNSVTYNIISVNAGSWLTSKRLVLERT